MNSSFDILTPLDAIDAFQTRPAGIPECPDGGAILAIEGLALSANTVTYAATGHQLGYWNFFPAAPGYGRIPTWGVARVTNSRCPDVETGSRFYGFLPLSSHLMVMPARAGAEGFIDGATHRRSLPSAYNRYWRVETDPYFKAGPLPLCAVLRPLVILSFLLENHIHGQPIDSSEAIVVSSASSKAALCAAYLARSRATRGPDWIGLTSERNAAFVRGTGAYAGVVSYDELQNLPMRTTTYLDFSGNAALRERLVTRLRPKLKETILIGATHWNHPSSATSNAEPDAKLFFAPDVLKTLMTAWGQAGLDNRLLSAFEAVVSWTQGWLSIDEPDGLTGLEAALKALFSGLFDPSRGVFVQLDRGTEPLILDNETAK